MLFLIWWLCGIIVITTWFFANKWHKTEIVRIEAIILLLLTLAGPILLVVTSFWAIGQLCDSIEDSKLWTHIGAWLDKPVWRPK